MLPRSLVPLTLACAALLGATAATAAGQASAPASEVRGWLLRIHDAASHRNFQGTFVVSGGGSVASARISHFYEGPNQYERIESLDGRQRKVFRHNDVVHTVWPASHVAMIEQRGLLNSFPALLQAGDDGLGEWYEVQAEGLDRVAGHEANVLAVKARDGYRYGYRLWADHDSGLLLRVDVIGEQGNVLETSAFSEVSIGVRPKPESIMQGMRKLDGYRIVKPVLTPTRLDSEGWTLRRLAPGFKEVSCVSRQIENPREASTEPALPPVIQTIFSDGLTYVSVFIEPYRADRHGQPMLAALGATQTLTQRHGNWWVTVIGDTPPATLKMFAAALERKKP
ncbi:MAG: MucB/RseB C-terminal domain-containing protein [Pseudomonadota bacterium]|nr:MucB/RseB C-terminal domain-containing protein [Pseudomonadota bacterium]